MSGPALPACPIDYRNGIDVMTTETTCLSSIWQTDEATEAILRAAMAARRTYQKLEARAAWLTMTAHRDRPCPRSSRMIALPFHPSYAYTIRELKANAADILRKAEQDAGQRAIRRQELRLDLTDKVAKDGQQCCVDQGVIAGCSGRYV